MKEFIFNDKNMRKLRAVRRIYNMNDNVRNYIISQQIEKDVI